MKTTIRFLMVLLTALMALTVPLITAQELQRNDDDSNYDRDHRNDRDDRNDRTRIDRYLDAELWTNHSDDEFYIGDNVVLNYRVNDDAFVAIYSVDTRGRVRLLYPSSPLQDNFVRGGVTYRLPDGSDDYDLSVTGPEGIETIQVVASRERFPIPDWYRNGLVADASDRDEYMDYLNSEYFVRYGGQRFAYDRARIYVNEWEPDYFRPVYHPVYPHWSVCGNVYFDYPWGASVYIDGIYWGCAPLYVPTVLVGWHTVTVYDPWGHCWEDDVHIMRRHTVVLDRTVIVTKPHVISKYKEIRAVGYRDPETNGYPKFKEVVAKKTVVRGGAKPVASNAPITRERLAEVNKDFTAPSKRYAKSVAPITKTERGYEAKGVTDGADRRSSSRKGSRTTDFSGSRKANTGSYGEDSQGKDAGTTDRSGNGIDKRGGSQDASGYRQTESPREENRSGNEYRKSDPAPSSNTGERKQAVSRTVERKSDGGSSQKGSDGKSGDSGKSKQAEAKSKSNDSNAQPQQSTGKSRGDAPQSKGKR